MVRPSVGFVSWCFLVCNKAYGEGFSAACVFVRLCIEDGSSVAIWSCLLLTCRLQNVAGRRLEAVTVSRMVGDKVGQTVDGLSAWAIGVDSMVFLLGCIKLFLLFVLSVRF